MLTFTKNISTDTMPANISFLNFSSISLRTHVSYYHLGKIWRVRFRRLSFYPSPVGAGVRFLGAARLIGQHLS